MSKRVAKELRCRHCAKLLPEDSDSRRRYCPGSRCRQNFHEALLSNRAAKIDAQTRYMRAAHNLQDPELKEIKSRALDVLEDEVRDAMRDAIRAEITPVIREKAQGAVVVMLDMLPKALARLAQDLDSKDAVARRNAVAIALKYTMPTVQDNTKVAEAARSHTVYHFIPSPGDTQVGKRVNEELAYNPADNYEDFEADWAICSGCLQRVPPENVQHPAGFDNLPMCSSCAIRGRLERSGDTAFTDNPLL